MPFNRKNYLYVGLNKIKGLYDPEDLVVRNLQVKGDFIASARGAVSPAGPMAIAGARTSRKLTWEELPGIDESKRSDLIRVAEKVFSDVESSAFVCAPGEKFQAGGSYVYRGRIHYRLVTHDDWRDESQGVAPRLALWLIELVDPVPTEASEVSVTWVLLSGTADGQLTTLEGSSLSESRAGSQTEQLFEQLYCYEHGAQRSGGPHGFLGGPWLVLAARNMIGEYAEEQEVEVLFRCHRSIKRPTEGDDREVSYMGWSPASSDGREAPVSRLVLGSPFYVQSIPRPPAWREWTLRQLSRFLPRRGLRGRARIIPLMQGRPRPDGMS